MGVEYTHYFVTADEQWLPSADTARKVVEVLKKWNLLPDEEPECLDLFEDKVKKVKPDYDSHPRNGRVFMFEEVQGKAVEEALGPSGYDSVGPEDRYIHSITLIVGTDIKVQLSNEELNFTVERPPVENGRELLSHSELNEFSMYSMYYEEAYSTSSSSVFPVVKMSGRLENMKDHNFKGFWRGALILYCGKDIPKFADGDIPYAIKNPKLLHELESAFGTNLVEVGSLG